MKKIREKLRFISLRVQVLAAFCIGGILLLLVLEAVCIGKNRDFHIVFFATLALAVILTLIYVFWIYRPFQREEMMQRQFLDGYLALGQFHQMGEKSILTPESGREREKIGEILMSGKLFTLNKRQAQYLALQNQINPHFLYNTLDTIVWLIEGGDPDKAVNMVMSLSDFFRLVLSKGREYITIREEEMHIRSYLQIQQVRYRDILDYEIDFDPALYQYKILKLTLQPLVENSLYHGIKYKRAKGSIRVTGRLLEGRIVLTVTDDGVGMEAGELENLISEIGKPCKDTGKGFGLANVNERIRMNFGTEYGMTIQSAPGEGTTVTVTIPAEPYEQEASRIEEETTA